MAEQRPLQRVYERVRTGPRAQAPQGATTELTTPVRV